MSKNRDGMNSNPESCRTPCAECKNDYKQDDLPDVDLVPEHSRIVNFSCMLHFLSGKTLENCTCGVFSKLATVLAALVGDRQSV